MHPETQKSQESSLLHCQKGNIVHAYSPICRQYKHKDIQKQSRTFTQKRGKTFLTQIFKTNQKQVFNKKHTTRKTQHSPKKKENVQLYTSNVCSPIIWLEVYTLKALVCMFTSHITQPQLNCKCLFRPTQQRLQRACFMKYLLKAFPLDKYLLKTLLPGSNYFLPTVI